MLRLMTVLRPEPPKCVSTGMCCFEQPKLMRFPFYFVDESGLIRSANDPYFGLGTIKAYNPPALYREIRRIRDRHKMYDELKWSGMSAQKYPAIVEILELFFKTPSASFSCVVLNKKELDLKTHFKNDFWKAYCSFMIVLLKGSTSGKEEVATILADDYFSPSNVDMEGQVRNKLNSHYGRMVVGGCCQINSRASDILQITDILLGLTLYDLKLKEGVVPFRPNPKTQLLGYLHNKLGLAQSIFTDSSGKPTRNFDSAKFRAMIFDPAHSQRTLAPAKPKN